MKKKEEKPKYSALFHESVISDESNKIEDFLEKIKTLREKAKSKFPFKEGEKVAVMHAATGKFKFFAFVNRLEYSFGDSPYYVRYNKESKNGKKEKTISTLHSPEFMIPASEADINDKYVEPDLSKVKIHL